MKQKLKEARDFPLSIVFSMPKVIQLIFLKRALSLILMLADVGPFMTAM